MPAHSIDRPRASDPPIISIILPTFNSARFVREAIDSVLAQDVQCFELIAVDDGSTDDTLEILRTYQSIIRIERPHGGASMARNAGIAAARGSMLAFLDSDDVWPSNRLRVALAYFEEHPEIDYLLGKEMLFVAPGFVAPSWLPPHLLAEPHDAANTPTLMARREAFSRVGLFDRAYDPGEDTEWLVRAAEAGLRLARVPDTLVHRRLHGENQSLAGRREMRSRLIAIARGSIRRQRARNGTGQP